MEEKYSIFELERALRFVQRETSGVLGKLVDISEKRTRVEAQVSELEIKERELRKALNDLHREREEEKREIADLRALCGRIAFGDPIAVEDLGNHLLNILDKFEKVREEVIRLEEKLKLVHKQWQRDSDELSRRDSARYYAEQKYAMDSDY